MVTITEKGCLLNCSELPAIQITYNFAYLKCECYARCDPKLFHPSIFAQDLLQRFNQRKQIKKQASANVVHGSERYLADTK